MKTIIAGTRTFSNQMMFDHAMRLHGAEITEVVCGCAPGADWLGKKWAMDNKIPVRNFRADWVMFGKRAGPIRNRQMADYADACLIFWDGKSKGTQNMIDEMRQRGKPCVVIEYIPDEPF